MYFLLEKGGYAIAMLVYWRVHVFEDYFPGGSVGSTNFRLTKPVSEKTHHAVFPNRLGGFFSVSVLQVFLLRKEEPLSWILGFL